MPRVVFTDAAVDDLRRLGPAVAPKVPKKILLLERNAEAGEPLGGGLTNFRKLVVGNRHWRVVYRIDSDGSIEVCEIWAAGTRSDGEVYAEALARVRDASNTVPAFASLAEVVERLGRLTGGIEPSRHDTSPEPVPDWLAEKLIHVAKMPVAEVAALDAREAFERWNAFITSPRE